MMNTSKTRISVAMVNYTNTKPFLFGFENSALAEEFDLMLFNPASCAKAFDNNSVEIALVPVAFLDGRTDYKVITDYCIGCNGPVNSVALLSQVAIDDLDSLILDNHSMTSNRLVQVLLKYHWKKELNLSKRDLSDYQTSDGSKEAVIMIGDKVFRNEHLFKYKYDLGEYWKKMTGLPFTFAVWVAKKNISEEKIAILNSIIALGVHQIDEVLIPLESELVDYEHYLKKNLKFEFTSEYKNGLQKFLKEFTLENELISS